MNDIFRAGKTITFRIVATSIERIESTDIALYIFCRVFDSRIFKFNFRDKKCVFCMIVAKQTLMLPSDCLKIL